MSNVPDPTQPSGVEDAPPAGPAGPRVFVNDPVRIAWIVHGFVQAVIAVLLIASVVDEVVGGVIVGITGAAYAAFSKLFVEPATVPREPLEQLALAQRQAGQA